MKISVALAAYNGERYIGEQIESILSELQDGDEIIVSDDNPKGKTKAAVEKYSKLDSRVKYIEGKGKGVCKNFENAVNNCTGDVVFFCDQDDVWLKGKRDTVVKEIENGADVVLHDAMMTDKDLNVINPSFFEENGSQEGFLKNFIKNSYMGCCMAVKKDFLLKCLPFPEKLPMHDWWIGLIAEKYGKVKFIKTPLIYHRCHGDNVTGGKTSLKDKIVWRFRILSDIIRLK